MSGELAEVQPAELVIVQITQTLDLSGRGIPELYRGGVSPTGPAGRNRRPLPYPSFSAFHQGHPREVEGVNSARPAVRASLATTKDIFPDPFLRHHRRRPRPRGAIPRIYFTGDVGSQVCT